MASPLSQFWKWLYKKPVNRLKEQRLLAHRVAFVNSIRQTPAEFDKEILVIRTDDIGDYILFRNTLQWLRQAKPSYKITLVGHALWKEIAESWDGDFVDEFIWLQKGRFAKDEAYAQAFLQSLAAKKPEILIAPSYSRNPFIDDIIAALIPAQQKWGWQRSRKENKKWLRKHVDIPYTHTLAIPHGQHEYYLNNYFIEKACGNTGFPVSKPLIPLEKLPEVPGLPENYVVLFPGAAAKRKRWSTGNFAQVADYITVKHGYTSLVCGAPGDSRLAEEIAAKAARETKIVNYTGKTDLLQLATVIHHCRLIITNDTSAAHYAAALGKNAIVLLNGNSYGRFFPYPPHQHPNMHPFYPKNMPAPPYDWPGMSNIQSISIQEVVKMIESIENKE